jgi:hypothetical protein
VPATETSASSVVIPRAPSVTDFFVGETPSARATSGDVLAHPDPRGLRRPLVPATLGRMGRYKTGEKAPRTGIFDFDGYTDGSNSPAPTTDERRIPLATGEVFPPVKSSNKGAWWRG